MHNRCKGRSYGTFFSSDYPERRANTLRALLLDKIDHYTQDSPLWKKILKPFEDRAEMAETYIKSISGIDEIQLAHRVLQDIRANQKDQPFKISADFRQVLVDALCEHFDVTLSDINRLSGGPFRNGVGASPHVNTTFLAEEQYRHKLYKVLDERLKNRELMPLSQVVNRRMQSM